MRAYSLQDVRCALSPIPELLADAVIASREEPDSLNRLFRKLRDFNRASIGKHRANLQIGPDGL